MAFAFNFAIGIPGGPVRLWFTRATDAAEQLMEGEIVVPAADSPMNATLSAGEPYIVISPEIPRAE